MHFTLSTLLLPLALFPLLIQGAARPEESVAVTVQGIKIQSPGPVVLPGENSGEDGRKSRWGVGREIARRHPRIELDMDVSVFVKLGVGAGVDNGVGVGVQMTVWV